MRGAFLGLVFSIFGIARLYPQTNLVPNPSFENYSECPSSCYQIFLATPWVKVGGDGGIGFFHDCSIENCASISNDIGMNAARSGMGASSIILIVNNHLFPTQFEGNFLGVPLVSSLVQGHKYRIRFFMSLCDNLRFATRNIGVYFSSNQPQGNTNSLLTLIPQFRYTGDFLTDKIGWMKIEGEFIAQGGENFITIGNFDGYNNSDTLNLHDGGTVPSIGYWEGAAYYIDDVSVTEVDTTQEYEEAEEVREPNEAVGVREQLAISNYQLAIWPNPVGEVLRLQLTGNSLQQAVITVTDMLGRAREVEFTEAYEGTMQAQVGHLASGVYLLSATGKDGRVWRTKFLKE